MQFVSFYSKSSKEFSKQKISKNVIHVSKLLCHGQNMFHKYIPHLLKSKMETI